jgi:activator of HSP90 ATPase
MIVLDKLDIKFHCKLDRMFSGVTCIFTKDKTSKDRREKIGFSDDVEVHDSALRHGFTGGEIKHARVLLNQSSPKPNPSSTSGHSFVDFFYLGWREGGLLL